MEIRRQLRQTVREDVQQRIYSVIDSVTNTEPREYDLARCLATRVLEFIEELICARQNRFVVKLMWFTREQFT